MTVKDELKRLLKEYGKLRKPWVFRVRLEKNTKPGCLAEHNWHPGFSDCSIPCHTARGFDDGIESASLLDFVSRVPNRSA